jgi:hypothetical protein
MIPINSYLLGINERSPYKIIQDVSNQTIFEITKISNESLMNRSDLCQVFSSTSPSSYIIKSYNIPVKSTSTEAMGIISDGENLYVGLNSASTTDYDLVAYDYKDIATPKDRVDSGPGIIGLTSVGKNIFAINSSVNSAIQRFKFDSGINKVGDYKIPWSSSYNPVYATKISSIYPYLFIGLKKNTGEELLSIDLGLDTAIDRKWELDSSVQAIWPMYDKYLHLLISTAKEPEINDYCLDCDFPLNTFDLFGSLGNVRSLIEKDGSIYVGRSAGNNELFKINIQRDYSSTTPKYTYDLVNSIDVNEGVYSMLLSGRNLFIVLGKSNSKIQIRDSLNLSKIIQTIDTTSTISDIECVGDKIFGVGSDGLVNPIIFELIPIYE